MFETLYEQSSVIKFRKIKNSISEVTFDSERKNQIIKYDGKK
jgi:hypothetical protein